MFYLRNFKNFTEAELDFDQATTLIIGPNGSGKSNLIEAVELLSFLASGHRLHEVTDIGREGQIEIRGGLEACAKIGNDQFTVGFKGGVVLRDTVFPSDVTYEITVKVRPEPRIIGEMLKVKGRNISMFEILPQEGDTASADNQVRYDNNARGANKPVESIAADRSALSQYSRFAHGNKDLSESLNVIEAVISTLASPSVFDPIPRLMRRYERRTENQLARNGYNISPVLFNLSIDRPMLKHQLGGPPKRIMANQRDVLERILNRIAQLPDEAFSRFDFVRMPKVGDVMFCFKLANRDEAIDARLLSDGTLRALAILTALETSKSGSRLILEEFDNGVHPSRVPVMALSLFDCAARNKLHVIATTHNPATMNSLKNEQLDSVLLVVSDQEKNTARLVRLRDLPGHVELIERGRLGDLVTRRIYEQHLRPNYEEERQAGIEDWAATLP
ncbi:MAG: AAA family ATPase [Verrucomicrobiales bacterium]|nr:AAA family ATPase [Verrucomicrobiales bacterium]